MFNIPAIFYKVSPSRANLWVIEIAVLELETEVGVNGEEQ